MDDEHANHYGQLLLESTSEGIYGIGLDGLCTFANRAASELTGWPVEELVGREVHSLLHHHRADGSLYPLEDCPIYATFREGHGCRVSDEVFWRRDGSTFHVDYSSHPIQENGKVTGAIVTFMNVSERVRAEMALRDSEARKSGIMSSVLDAILTIDREGRIVEYNAAAERMFGYRREEAVGQEMAALIIPPALRERHRRGLAQCVATGEGPILDQRIEVPAMRADGTEFPVELTVTPIAVGGESAFTGFVRDLTERKAAEAALRVSQEEQQLLAEAIPQQLWTAHPDGKLNYVNARVVEYFGRSRETLIGAGWLDVVHPDDRAKTVERWQRALAEGTPYEVEFRLRRVDGTDHWHLGRALPMRDSSGAIVKWFGTNTDISEHKAAEMERELAAHRSALIAEASAVLGSSLQYETTLSNIARLVVPTIADWCTIDLVGPNGEIQVAAVAHADPSKVALAHELRRRFPPQPEDRDGIVGVLRTGEPVLYPVIDPELLRANSRNEEHYQLLESLRLRSAMIVPMRSSTNTIGTLTLIRESETAFTESELAFAQNLATRAAFAVENARLYTSAQRANAAKDHFFAVLSHELRTPLNPVLMSVSAMQSDHTIPSALRDEIAMIRRNVELEARLIDDLLDITRISNNKLTLNRQVVDAHELMEYAAHIVRTGSVAAQAPVTLELNAVQAHVDGDPARLQQIFWNLLKNAVKFTPATGTVTVRSSNPEPGQLQIDVIDSGRGIDPNLLSTIFDAFEQEQVDGHLAAGGLGLGLAISKALVELHDGRLIASSEGRDRGATFSLTLPVVSAPAANTPSARAALAGATSKLRILVVEDHQDTANMMKHLLRRSGHQVRIVHTVHDALAAAAEDPFDIVLSDVGLPDGSGVDLMRQLRDRHGLRGIALSGHGRDFDQQRSAEAGFLAHLTKPIDFTRLMRALAEIPPAEPPKG